MGLKDFIQRLFRRSDRPPQPPAPAVPRFDPQTGAPASPPAPPAPPVRPQNTTLKLEIAWRRATDITFLGRGVSAGLADRVSQVARLEAFGLPVYATPADLAQALGLTIPRLRWLAFHADAAMVSHYVCFTIPKKSGSIRQLSAPHHDLAAAQEWILEKILRKVPIHDAAHGFVSRRSTVT